MVSIVKGVPLDPAIAGAVAAAVLQAAQEEDDAASPRFVSLGRMLRCAVGTTPGWDTLGPGQLAHPPSSLLWSAHAPTAPWSVCRVLNRKHASAVESAVNGVLDDGVAAASEPGATARRQRLLPLLSRGLAGGAGAALPNSITTLRLAVDAASPAARIVVRVCLCPFRHHEMQHCPARCAGSHAATASVLAQQGGVVVSAGAARTGPGGPGGGVGTAAARSAGAHGSGAAREPAVCCMYVGHNVRCSTS